jgi:hypothetical protein
VPEHIKAKFQENRPYWVHQVTKHERKILSKAKLRGQIGKVKLVKVDHPGGHVLIATRHCRGSHTDVINPEVLKCLLLFILAGRLVYARARTATANLSFA